MRLNSITFFKTPLDDKYRNVFDFNRNFDSENSFKSHYFDSLYDNYESFDITFDSGEERAINRKDDIIFITIPYTYETLHEFNYVCFNEKYYYFILNIEELNSIPNNECCKIVLSKDIWIDNYYAYKHGEYNKVQNIQCKHLKRYEKPLGGKYKIVDDFPLTYETEPNSKSKILNDTNGYLFDGDCRILWLRFTVEKGLKVKIGENDNGFIYGNIDPENFGYNYSILQHLFVPFIIFKNNSLEWTFVNKVWAYTEEGDPAKTVVADYTENRFYFIPDTMMEYILNIDLTFNAPINARAFFNSGEVDVEGYSSPVYFPRVTGTTQGGSSIITYDLIWVRNFPIYKAHNFVYNYDRKENFIDYKPTINFNKYDKYTDSIGDCEPAFYMYPWYYKSVKFYNDEIDLISPTFEHSWFIKYEPRGQGLAYILAINNEQSYEIDVGNNKVATINPNGSIPTYKDAYQSYLRNNGNSLTTDYETKTIRTVVNYATNAASNVVSGLTATKDKEVVKAATNIVGGAVSGIMDIYENERRYKAKIYDLANAQDSYSLPSTFANLDLYYQDRAMIYSINGDNTIVKNKLRLKLVEYGSNVDAPYDITENTRVFYDYIKTENCSVPSIINLDEREKFEKILDGGVRKWHIDEIDNMREDEHDINNIYNKIKNFNTLVCNMEKEEE